MSDDKAIDPAVRPAADAGFGAALLALSRAYHADISHVVEKLPHGARGYQTLAAVVRGDQPSQAALATALGIDRTVMVYLLDDLVAAGYVERQQNPSDRRQYKVVPTEKGLKVYDDLKRQVWAAEDELLSTLKPEERDMFRDLLQRAGAVLDKFVPATSDSSSDDAAEC